MGTVYLRNTTAPDGTYQNLATSLSHAQLDNNLTLFLRNDVSDTMTGTLTVTGDVVVTSDRRFKTNIKQIENALSKVLSLNGYTFTKIDTGEESTGVIAQEVREQLPQAVDGTPDKLSVRYGNLVGLLIEAIKEQQVIVEELKLTIKELQNK